MGNIIYHNDQKMVNYAQNLMLKETPELAKLRSETLARHPYPQMMTPPLQTQFICQLLQLMDARRVIEVGIFTGYTTLAMAEALPEDGEVIACDKNAEWVGFGKPFWSASAAADKIALCIEDAKITLQNLLDEGQAGSFDAIYVDADKIHYREYYRLTFQLLRPGGLLIFDNVLKLTDRAVYDGEIPAARSVKAFNAEVSQDSRVDISVLPMFSGVLLARRKMP